MSAKLKAPTAPSTSTSTVGVGDVREESYRSRMGSLRTVAVADAGIGCGTSTRGNDYEDRRTSGRSGVEESEDRVLAEEKAVERSGTSVVFGRVRRDGGEEDIIRNGDDILKPRLSQAKRQWSIQAVKGKVTTSCLWNACKALTIGTLLIFIGAAMATIGYYAEEANLRRLQNLTEAAAAAAAAAEAETTTASVRNTGPWIPPQIAGPPRPSLTPKATPKAPSAFGLNKLSYVGPMVMGIGGFVIVAACVMTFEARDSAAKIVPARFRKPFPERPVKVEDTGVRHCAAQTKWETLGVYGSELTKYHQEKELSRRAMTSAFIRFSKTIQSSMDSTIEYYELKGGPRSNLVKCPSAPSLIREFHQEERRSIEAPRILRVSAFPRPPPRRRLSSNAYPRQAMSVDNPAVREVYTASYPAFIGEKGDEEMELGASATAVHRVDSDASLALDLHFPQCAVTLSVRDSSRSPSAHTDHEEVSPATPLLDQVIILPPEEVAGPSGVNSLHVTAPVQPKVDKQTSTTDHNHLAMMGWSRETLDSRENHHSSRSKSGGSFRESKRPKSSRKVKRSETIDTASSVHRKSHKSHHPRSRAGSILSTHEGRRLGPSRSETARKHQLLRQTKVDGTEVSDDAEKGVVV